MPNSIQDGSSRSFSRSILLYLIYLLVLAFAFHSALEKQWKYAMTNDNGSHIPLIPLLSLYLLYTERDRIFCSRGFRKRISFVFCAAGVLVGFAPYVLGSVADESTTLALRILALILLSIAGFSWFFGEEATRAASFPLAFLLLAIPFPEFLLSRTIYLLQEGSAAVAGVVFDIAGVPALREGFVFRLPHISIEVARECSGIRSSIALFILALLIAHLSFKPYWKKAAFVIAGLVMMVVKNGVRIASLTMLATYVNPGFLYGRLHKEGGVVFFLLGLALLLPVYWLLRRGEEPPSHPQPRPATA